MFSARDLISVGFLAAVFVLTSLPLKVWFWICGGVLLFGLLFLGWALCAMASQADKTIASMKSCGEDDSTRRS